MDIVLSQKTDKPIYTQIYEQISAQIMSGELAAGEKLPPIRTVAVNLRISVIPVKQAWEQLEREGFISTAVGRGSFVSELAHHEISDKRNSTAEELLAPGVSTCREMGLSLKEVQDIVGKLYDA
ncbi:MAG: GntR family transcriptional regulator [Treponema sp.]|nr:GntR family transcriptional regulator [Treponema sp.]MBP5751808.1 GntR family transcriptional regulator [Treponema sp.]